MLATRDFLYCSRYLIFRRTLQLLMFTLAFVADLPSSPDASPDAAIFRLSFSRLIAMSCPQTCARTITPMLPEFARLLMSRYAPRDALCAMVTFVFRSERDAVADAATRAVISIIICCAPMLMLL